MIIKIKKRNILINKFEIPYLNSFITETKQNTACKLVATSCCDVWISTIPRRGKIARTELRTGVSTGLRQGESGTAVL